MSCNNCALIVVYSIIYRIVNFLVSTKFGKTGFSWCVWNFCLPHSTIGTHALCLKCRVYPNCQILLKTVTKASHYIITVVLLHVLYYCCDFAFFSPCQGLSGNGLTASEWVKSVTSIIGGKGGGSEANAQASGVKVDQLSEAVEAAKLYASSRVNNWWSYWNVTNPSWSDI